MGVLPMGLLVPFKQLRYLNISGNHLDNMSLQVIDPCRELEVSAQMKSEARANENPDKFIEISWNKSFAATG